MSYVRVGRSVKKLNCKGGWECSSNVMCMCGWECSSNTTEWKWNEKYLH